MTITTTEFISNAFKERWNVELPLATIRQMVLIPSVDDAGEQKPSQSEIYGICLFKDGQEVMYLAKILKNKYGRIEKAYVAVHPPLRQAAREWYEGWHETEATN